MNDLIQDIIKNKQPVYFISPHFDDAALSCGGLIHTLAGKTDVSVITVFTAVSHPTNTASAKKTLQNSNFADAVSLYAARAAEDRQAFAGLPIHVVHLGEIEALWRKRKVTRLTHAISHFLPELEHVYPTYRFHIIKGNVSRHDTALVKRVATKLKQQLKKNAVVFSPAGVGNHVDHLVTRRAVEEITTPILWIDQPYHIRKQEKMEHEGRKLTQLAIDQKRKETMITAYKTQIPLLFSGSTLPVLNEYYLLP